MILYKKIQTKKSGRSIGVTIYLIAYTTPSPTLLNASFPKISHTKHCVLASQSTHTLLGALDEYQLGDYRSIMLTKPAKTAVPTETAT